MKSLLTYIEEGMQQFDERSSGRSIIDPVDPETQMMLNVAKSRYPAAKGDDLGSLAQLVRRANKHSIDADDRISAVHNADVKANELVHQHLDKENDVEDAAIAKLDKENDDEEIHIANNEHRLDDIDKALIDLRRQIAVLLGKQ